MYKYFKENNALCVGTLRAFKDKKYFDRLVRLQHDKERYGLYEYIYTCRRSCYNHIIMYCHYNFERYHIV